MLLLAGLYTLRVLAGIAAAHVRFSTWLLAFSMFLFLSLAFLKRYTEVSAMGGAGRPSRCAGADTSGATGSGSARWAGASGYLSVLVLALYINSEQVVALYRRPLLLWLVCPCCCSGPAACGCWRTAAGSTTTRSSPRCAIRRATSSGALVALVLYLAL